MMQFSLIKTTQYLISIGGSWLWQRHTYHKKVGICKADAIVNRTFVLIGVARIIQDSSSILVTKNNWFPAIMLFPREQLSQIPNRRWTFILCECLHLFINCLCHLFRSASFIWQLLYIRQCDNKPFGSPLHVHYLYRTTSFWVISYLRPFTQQIQPTPDQGLWVNVGNFSILLTASVPSLNIYSNII